MKIRSWKTKGLSEKDGVFFFEVTSDGTTGEEWIPRLIKNGFQSGTRARKVLLSRDFRATTGVTTKVAILRGSFFKDGERSTEHLLAEGGKRRFGKPNPEVACLTREVLANADIEKMGLVWIVSMHNPVDGLSLTVGCDDGGYWLGAREAKNPNWCSWNGFAYSVLD